MAFDQWDQHPGLRFLFTLAIAVILIQGLRFAQPVLLPLALALFLAATCLPVVFWLKGKRVPLGLAVAVAVLAVAGVFGLLIVAGSLQLPALGAHVRVQIEAVFGDSGPLAAWVAATDASTSAAAGGASGIAQLAVDYARDAIASVFDVPTMTALVTGATTWALSFLSTTFLVFLILAFALGEASILPHKLRAIAPAGVGSDERFATIVEEVQGYLVIKTLVSLVTGVVLGLWTWALGLELPLLLGLIAFALNYVPTIGSVIASVPALLLALVEVRAPATPEASAATGAAADSAAAAADSLLALVEAAPATFVGLDVQGAVIVGLGYLAVNIVLGNWLEPTLMGRRLGLSTLIVVLSLVFWGWLWGPLGALLSVPLTMVVKIMLENTKDLRWIAALLDKNPPSALAGGEPAP